VLHNISLPPGHFGGPHVANLFLNRLDFTAHPALHTLRGLRVSTHFFVRRDGAIMQFVATEARAWHAGASRFGLKTGCNDFSLGIELEGTDTLPYTNAQYEALRQLVPTLRARYPLVAVRGHAHIAPERKTDPGPAFDWLRFARDNGFFARQLPPL
jgi:AmpD protein